MSNPILLGYCPVDSGQILLVDPCYVEDGLDYNEVCTSHTVDKNGGVAEIEQGSYFKNYALGVGGPVKGIMGVVTGTAWGDGQYPVYANIEDGHVASVTIYFDGDPNNPEEDKDEDMPCSRCYLNDAEFGDLCEECAEEVENEIMEERS